MSGHVFADYDAAELQMAVDAIEQYLNAENVSNTAIHNTSLTGK